MSRRYDVVVIGGGAGGLTAAYQASRMGALVALVADGALGGDCTHTGCVPSKTLLAAAARGDDFATAMRTVRETVARIAATEDANQLEGAGIAVLQGRGRFIGAGRLDVDGTTMLAERMIVATGARPQVPPVPGFAKVGPLTSETVFDLRDLPASLVVLGAGPSGCELAQAFARFGCRVTLLDQARRVLPEGDREASAVLEAALRSDGVEVRTGVELTEVSPGATGATGATISLADGTAIEAAALLVAAGRVPTTDGLGVDTAGIDLDETGHIVIDDTCATSVKGIWAVGDVTQHGGTTHAAGHLAYVAARNATRPVALARLSRIHLRSIPRVTYTDPEVASVGLTEAEAVAQGGQVAHLPMTAVDRAVTSGRTDGFVTLIAGPRRLLGMTGGGQLLGATVVAPVAGELIGELALAMRTRMFVGRLAQTVHAYPSWSMAVQLAATQFVGGTGGPGARSTRPARAEGGR